MSFPLWLYRAGYTDLISVIPPGAELVPGSRMQTSSLGKAPGRRVGGKWTGYPWRTYQASETDIAQWVKDGASFGLRADRFPGLDIDVTDAALAEEIEALAQEALGGAPVRFGRRPKRLLMFRTAEPISRMRLWLERDGASHLVELLGAGQQYVVHGIHPVTGQLYEWAVVPPASEDLACITRAQVDALFLALAAKYGSEWQVYREGDGYARQNAPTDQAALRAPSIDTLQELVDRLPNTDAAYPGRDAYIRVGYAIRAAAGDAVEEGYDVFASWANRHGKDGRVAGNPATWREDYARMRPPFAIGWAWLQNEAQRFGHHSAQDDFSVLTGPLTPIPVEGRSSFLGHPGAIPEGPVAPSAAASSVPGRLPNGDDAGHSLAEYLEHPELAEMPPEVVPHFAWEGLKTLFSGREKTGKSTLLLAGIAAATKGEDFLGGGTEPRTVLWLTEEAVRLTVRRAVQMGADPDRLKLVSMGKDPTLQLAHAVGKWSPDVVVIDTLFRYAAVEDENQASAWRPYLEQFDAVTRRGTALVLVVHALKAHDDGRYRGSSALGAWVDVVMAMKTPAPESSVRDITCVGRVDADAFSVRYDQGTFKLLANGQKEQERAAVREREVLGWIAAGELQGHKLKKGEAAGLEARGLIVKEGGSWRVTTADERAQKEMRQ